MNKPYLNFNFSLTELKFFNSIAAMKPLKLAGRVSVLTAINVFVGLILLNSPLNQNAYGATHNTSKTYHNTSGHAYIDIGDGSHSYTLFHHITVHTYH